MSEERVTCVSSPTMSFLYTTGAPGGDTQPCKCRITFYCNVRPAGSGGGRRGTMLLCVNREHRGGTPQSSQPCLWPQKSLENVLLRSNCTLILPNDGVHTAALKQQEPAQAEFRMDAASIHCQQHAPGKDLAFSSFYAV